MQYEWVTIFDDLSKALKTFELNTSKKVTIDTHTLCLSRLHDGFFIINDRCPHDGASMSLGTCKASGTIECPWHHYLFDIRTGRNIGGTCNNITCYPTKTENNSLQVGIPIVTNDA